MPLAVRRGKVLVKEGSLRPSWLLGRAGKEAQDAAKISMWV